MLSLECKSIYQCVEIFFPYGHVSNFTVGFQANDTNFDRPIDRVTDQSKNQYIYYLYMHAHIHMRNTNTNIQKVQTGSRTSENTPNQVTL